LNIETQRRRWQRRDGNRIQSEISLFNDWT
jgi:hypothetical protein